MTTNLRFLLSRVSRLLACPIHKQRTLNIWEEQNEGRISDNTSSIHHARRYMAYLGLDTNPRSQCQTSQKRSITT
jgi:hypothetical protein